MDRRTFIASSAAATLATVALPKTVLAQPRADSGDAALNALLERIFQQALGFQFSGSLQHLRLTAPLSASNAPRDPMPMTSRRSRLLRRLLVRTSRPL